MHRLLYTSTARLTDAVTGDTTLHALAAKSARSNQALGLTGLLLYIDGTFIQTLEGSLEDLEAVFERICCDFRHWDLRLIDLAPAPERHFADWGMACVLEDENTSAELATELRGVQYLVGVNAAEAVREMRHLLDRYPPRKMAA